MPKTTLSVETTTKSGQIPPVGATGAGITYRLSDNAFINSGWTYRSSVHHKVCKP